MDENLPLKPLQNSFTETKQSDLEAELRDLFVQLYAQELQEKGDTINVFGMPHLGPLPLMQRLITDDGLTLISDGDEDRIRYLFKAWRYLNPRRGLHFLRCYLDVLWPGSNDAQLMWQKQSEPYPKHLMSQSEIEFNNESETDFYLTSRVRVDLDTDRIPERVQRSLRTSLAAKYVLDLRIAKYIKTDFSLGGVVGASGYASFKGRALLNVPSGRTRVGIAGVSNTAVVAFYSGRAVAFDPAPALNDVGTASVSGAMNVAKLTGRMTR